MAEENDEEVVFSLLLSDTSARKGEKLPFFSLLGSADVSKQAGLTALVFSMAAL